MTTAGQIQLPLHALFAGKGGVGKSSSSLALARKESLRGHELCLLSLDPSHGLSRYLEEESFQIELLDPKKRVDAWRSEDLDTLAEILSEGTYFQASALRDLLQTPWPGLDEWVGFSALTERAYGEEKSFCQVIADLAPGVHGHQLLRAHENLYAWVELLEAFLERRRYLQTRFSSSHTASLADPLESYLQSGKAQLRRMAEFIENSCLYLVITEDPRSVREAAALVRTAHTTKVPWPRAELLFLPHRRTLEDEAVDATLLGPELCTLPFHRSADLGLCDFYPVAIQREKGHDGILLSLPEKERFFGLHCFTGKGGSGKTRATIACLQNLQAQQTGQQITWVGFELPSLKEREAFPTVRWQVIDIDEELHDFQEEMQTEWQRVLPLSPSMELPFETRALNLLSELAPPGLETLSAFVVLGRILSQNEAEVLLFDAPSTGHFFRLLELFEEGTPWIEALLTLLEAHSDQVTLPRVTRRLLSWRRQLRKVRRALRDPESGAIWILDNEDPESCRQAELLHRYCKDLNLAPIRRITTQKTWTKT